MINSKQALHRLAILVKNHRAEVDMTYREYSRLFGDLSPNISNIEKENLIDLPNLKTLSKLADVLGIKLSKLIDYMEYGENLDQVFLKADKSNVIAAIKQIRDFDELLDIDQELSIQKLKYRHFRESDKNSGRKQPSHRDQ